MAYWTADRTFWVRVVGHETVVVGALFALLYLLT